jgi:hypothetical protein
MKSFLLEVGASKAEFSPYSRWWPSSGQRFCVFSLRLHIEVDEQGTPVKVKTFGLWKYHKILLSFLTFKKKVALCLISLIWLDMFPFAASEISYESKGICNSSQICSKACRKNVYKTFLFAEYMALITAFVTLRRSCWRALAARASCWMPQWVWIVLSHFLTKSRNQIDSQALLEHRQYRRRLASLGT